MADPGFEAFLWAVGQQESGNAYFRSNGQPVLSSAGAIGRWQVMPGNVPKWSRQVLGYSITATEFAHNPALQERIVRGILGGYYQQYGARGAAAAWFTGSASNANNYRNMGGGASSPGAYVDSVLNLAKRAPVGNAASIKAGQIGTMVPGTLGATSAAGALNATTASSPPTPEELAREFGYSTAFFNTDPSLKRVIDQATREGWDPTTAVGQARFQAAIRNTSWYQRHSEAQRQWAALVQGDPTTATNKVNTMVKEILFQAVQQGAQMDLKSAHNMAVEFLSNGIDQNSTLLQAAIGAHVVYQKGKPFTGQAGQYEQEYRKLTQDYGVPTSDDQIAFYVLNTSNMKGSENTVRNYLQNQAKNLYPGLAAAIDSGLTVRQAMDPYFQTIAQTLEVSPDSFTVKDPLIQRALQYRPVGADPSKPTSVMPLWEFQNAVRNDPRWLKTDNARNSTTEAATQVLQDMGLIASNQGANYGSQAANG